MIVKIEDPTDILEGRTEELEDQDEEMGELVDSQPSAGVSKVQCDLEDPSNSKGSNVE